MFSHLHLHTDYSFRDGICRIEPLIQRAVELGMSSVAITDHGNVDGWIPFNKACKKHGIKPIFGTEFYVVDDPKLKKARFNNHLVVLAKGKEGIKNIRKLVSKSSRPENFYYRPRCSWSDILKLEDVIVMTACIGGALGNASEVSDKVRVNAIPLDPWEFTEKMAHVFGEDFYLEVQPLPLKEQEEINSRALQLSDRYGVKLITTNDVHYIYREESRLHEIVLALKDKKKWSDDSRFKYPIDDLYFTSRDELKSFFLDRTQIPEDALEQALDNTHEIADKIGDDLIDTKDIVLPVERMLFSRKIPTQNTHEYLSELAQKGLESKNLSGEYVERLDYELGVLEESGSMMSDYFLIVWELLDWCNQNGIMYGPGRGSVSGSILAYVLDITCVDPLEHGLIFERFLRPGRTDLPDIDMDFDASKRDLVIKHLQDVYGEEYVGQVAAYARMGGRQVLRDVCTTFEIDQEEVGAVTSFVDSDEVPLGEQLTTARDEYEEVEEFAKKYPEEFGAAVKLEGTVRHRTVHAAGVVLSTDRLDSGKNCSTYVDKDRTMVAVDKDELEGSGLMKLDVLGVHTVSTMSDTTDLVKERHGVDINLKGLKFDDPVVLGYFNRGDTLGVFQLNRPTTQRILADMGVDKFEDIVVTNALIRPGTARAAEGEKSTTEKYIEVKENPQDVQYIHERIKEFTEETYGFLVYQEQIVRMAVELAGMTWAEADAVRKGIAKKTGITDLKDKFVEGCLKEKTLTEEEALEVVSLWENYGKYLFNKAHATGYAFVSYWNMWARHYYPLEYWCAYLTHQGSSQSNKVRIPEIKNELEMRGYKLVSPHINGSGIGYTIHEDVIYEGLTTVDYLGDKSAAYIIQERNGGYKSLQDLMNRVPRRSCNKRVLAELLNAGCLEGLDLEPESLKEIEYEGIPGGRVEPDVEASLDDMISILKTSFKVVKPEDLKAPESELCIVGDVSAYGPTIGNVKLEYPNVVELADRRCVAVGSWDGEKFIADKVSTIQGLFEGGVSYLSPRAIKKVDIDWYNGYAEDLLKCGLCNYWPQKRVPMSARQGAWNVIIVAEAPGKVEERQGVPLTGPAGEVLWRALRKHDLTRNNFVISNVLKCRPPNNKFPGEEIAEACSSHWLEKEIKRIDPILILAAGNWARWFFTGEKSGILGVAGRTQWNKEWNCFISFSCHPSSVLHSEKNLPILEQSIKEFARMVRALVGL